MSLLRGTILLVLCTNRLFSQPVDDSVWSFISSTQPLSAQMSSMDREAERRHEECSTWLLSSALTRVERASGRRERS